MAFRLTRSRAGFPAALFLQAGFDFSVIRIETIECEKQQLFGQNDRDENDDQNQYTAANDTKRCHMLLQRSVINANTAKTKPLYEPCSKPASVTAKWSNRIEGD